MNKTIIYAVIGLVVAGGLFWYFFGRIETTMISSATVIEGDYNIEDRQRIIVENGSEITVNGDLNLKGEINCEGGPLNLVVRGDAVIDNKLVCSRPEEVDDIGEGISLVVGGNLTVGDSAVIASNGHVQIVADASDLITTQEDLEKLYDDAGKDSGTGPRLGPFTYENLRKDVSLKMSKVASLDDSIFLAHGAEAQVPRDKDANPISNVIISGNWVIGEGGAPPSGVDVPKPPKKVKKIILNFNFGNNGNVELRDFHLLGPDGRDGKDDIDQSCSAHGEKGEDAFRMRVIAQNITLNNFRLELGDGG